MPQLTQEQSRLLDYVEENRRGTILFTGGAGTGKTVALAALAREFPGCNFLAPTHQAAGVLHKKLTDAGARDFTLSTVASYVHLVPDLDRLPEKVWDTPYKLAFRDAAVQLSKDSILIADEVSMIPLEYLQAIKATAKNALIILSGDSRQIRPPKRKDALTTAPFPALMEAVAEGAVRHLHLTENLRAESPALIAYINKIRHTGHFPKEVPSDGSVHLYTDQADFDRAITEYVQRYGQRNVAALAYTNAAVDARAIHIRKALGFTSPYFQPGEILRLNDSYETMAFHDAMRAVEWEYRGQNLDRPELIRLAKKLLRATDAHNGDLVEVVGTQGLWSHKVAWSRQYVELQKTIVHVLTGVRAGTNICMDMPQVGNYDAESSDLHVMLSECKAVTKSLIENRPDDIKTGAEEVKQLLIQAAAENRIALAKSPRAYYNGRFFYGPRSKVAYIQSALSITTHKAQGSERDYIFVDGGDIRGPEAKELRYTAASRAQKELHILL